MTSFEIGVLKFACQYAKAGDIVAMWATPGLVHEQSIFWRQHFIEALGYGNTRILGGALGLTSGLLCSSVSCFPRSIFILLAFLVLFTMSPQMPWGRIPALFCDNYTHRACVYEYSYRSNRRFRITHCRFLLARKELRVDGKLRWNNVKLATDGLVSVNLPAGSHRAELRYNLSPEGKFARVFSNATTSIWVAIFFRVHTLSMAKIVKALAAEQGQ